jgi:glycosyltransferase involved in cell wall biosynthesis
LSILEALGAGKAVVATAVGGNPALVVNDVTGCLVPDNQVHELAAALQRLLADAGLRARLAEQGRRLVRERYSIDGMLLRYRSLYADLFQARRVPEAGH